MKKKKVLLIYTELGFNGSYLIQAPISLVYVSTKLVHIPGIEIEILDCRIEPDWREKLRRTLLEDDVLTVGFFVIKFVLAGWLLVFIFILCLDCVYLSFGFFFLGIL